MSNDTYNMNNDKKSISYGAKLKAARESIGLEQKDIAAQLRLSERIIDMLESGHYSSDVPVTFIRGYLRSYSKLLQISESDVAAALEVIEQPALTPQEFSPVIKQPADVTSSNYYMQFSTYAIAATLTGMLGLWWYNHTPSQSTVVAQSQTLLIPQQVAAESQSNTLAPVATQAIQNATAAATTTTTAAPLSANSAPQLAANTTTPATANTATPTANAATGTTTPTTTAPSSQQTDSTKPAPAAHPHHTKPVDDDEDDDDDNSAD